MDLLLDTHAFLWFIQDDRRLSKTAKSLIEAPSNVRFVSVVSLWEIALKMSVGKLTINGPFAEFILQQLTINQMTLLPIAITHLEKMIELPFHHRDPFDRLLIAQSMNDDLTLLSRDRAFEAYRVQRVWD